MKTYRVTRNNMHFLLMVNDSFDENANDSYPVGPVQEYETLERAEVMMDFVKHDIHYLGRDKITGKNIISFDLNMLFYYDDVTTPTPDILRKAFAVYQKKDLYMITTAEGRIFYEACNDMTEKKDLYSELGAKITLIQKYDKRLKISGS